MKKLPFLEAIGTLIGTIIGAGVLGIPYVIAKAGFLTGLVDLFIIGFAVLILYLATIIDGTLQAGDDAEEVRYFSFDELPEKIAFESNRQALADYRKKILNRD